MSNAYISIAQFESYFDSRQISQLSGDSNSRVAVESVIQDLLDAAASEVDSALTGRFALPVLDSTGNAPLVIRRAVAMIAVYNHYLRRGSVPDGIRAEVENIRAWLQKVIDREVGIPGVGRSNMPRLVASEYTDGRSRFDSGARDFDRGPSSTSTSGGRQG